MRNQKIRNLVYYVSSSITALSIFGATIIGAALKVDTKTSQIPVVKNFADEIQVLQDFAWLLLIFFGLASVGSKGLSYFVGRPWVWKSINSVVDELRHHVFTQCVCDDHEPYHYNRITLFKYVRFKFWIWPWRGITPWGGLRHPFSGWLIPVSRSGHTTQNTSTVFLAPDDADSAEGVAGRTWQSRTIVPRLDQIQVDRDSDDTEISEYAKNTWISEKLVRKRLYGNKVLPRSLCGIPVEANGKVWGVIVLDSRRSDGIKDPKVNTITYTITARLLEKLLSRRASDE